MLAGVHGTRPPWRGLGGTLLPARQASEVSEASPPCCRSMCRPPPDPIGPGLFQQNQRLRAEPREAESGQGQEQGRVWGRGWAWQTGPTSATLPPQTYCQCRRLCSTRLPHTWVFVCILCSRWGGPCDHLHCAAEEAETQRRQGTCPKSHRRARSPGLWHPAAQRVAQERALLLAALPWLGRGRRPGAPPAPQRPRPVLGAPPIKVLCRGSTFVTRQILSAASREKRFALILQGKERRYPPAG